MRAQMTETSTMPLPSFELGFTPGQPDPRSAAREWLLADAQGGFAMGTAGGTPTRRYHALLIAALTPPVRRYAMLSAIDEHLHVPNGGSCYLDHDGRLTRFRFADNPEPTPVPTLAGFTRGVGTCTWDHTIPTQLGTVRVRKTLTLGDRADACRIDYDIETAIHSPEPDRPITLTLRPLLAMRDFHELNHTLTLDQFGFEMINEPAVEGVRVTRHGLDAALHIRGVRLQAQHHPAIWHGIRYDHETRRGQSDREDLLCPISFTVVLEPRATTSVSIECSLASSVPDIQQAQQRRSSRVQTSIDHALASAGNPIDQPIRGTIAKLACAADDFVVDRVMRGTTSSSIIAGYPWFSDWGRDTMIALPGLLLTTGRYEEALHCLRTFAEARQHGLIPNRFDDFDGPAHFNTVDAPLWFVHACQQWSLAADKPLEPALIDACDDIIDAYTRGTINKIALDPHDGLIRCGDAKTQLTWMDALRDGVAFTPRHGKPIEINALWINALRARCDMGSISDDRREQLLHNADHAQRTILSAMTAGPHGGLVDCLTPVSAVRSFSWQRSDECRPNQLFAISLPGVQLPSHIAQQVVRAAQSQLLTPVGIRTLSPDHPLYIPHYTGTMFERDRAYHNGTVWPWLMGAYCEAKLRTDPSSASRQHVTGTLLSLASMMDHDSIGSIFEIYDAEPGPDGKHAPQGCPAQAWSISETLRMLVRVSRTLD